MRRPLWFIVLMALGFGDCVSAGIVKSSPQVGVKRVRFQGELLFPPKRLQRAMDVDGDSAEAIQEGVAHVRSMYMLEGYLDADVHAEIAGQVATVSITAGRKYELPQGLCSGLQIQRRQSERQGIMDFAARLTPGDTAARVETGEPVRVGRIDFVGNHHHSDRWLRRNLRIMEGDPFDFGLLRRSLDRLRRSGQFENVEALEPVRRGELANVTIRVTENKRGFWRISGPAGPVRIGGSLDASLGMRVFSTILISASVAPLGPPILTKAARLTPIFSLTRPFTPGDGWLSGLSWAPQLGWKNGFQALAEGYGTTQVQQRLLALLAGNRQPELPVTVEREAGDAVMYCPATKPSMPLLRKAATFGVYALGLL